MLGNEQKSASQDYGEIMSSRISETHIYPNCGSGNRESQPGGDAENNDDCVQSGYFEFILISPWLRTNDICLPGVVLPRQALIGYEVDGSATSLNFVESTSRYSAIRIGRKMHESVRRTTRAARRPGILAVLRRQDAHCHDRVGDEFVLTPTSARKGVRFADCRGPCVGCQLGASLLVTIVHRGLRVVAGRFWRPWAEGRVRRGRGFVAVQPGRGSNAAHRSHLEGPRVDAWVRGRTVSKLEVLRRRRRAKAGCVRGGRCWLALGVRGPEA